MFLWIIVVTVPSTCLSCLERFTCKNKKCCGVLMVRFVYYFPLFTAHLPRVLRSAGGRLWCGWCILCEKIWIVAGATADKLLKASLIVMWKNLVEFETFAIGSGKSVISALYNSSSICHRDMSHIEKAPWVRSLWMALLQEKQNEIIEMEMSVLVQESQCGIGKWRFELMPLSVFFFLRVFGYLVFLCSLFVGGVVFVTFILFQTVIVVIFGFS